MLVKIRTKEKCPKCGQKFAHIPRIGYICSNCMTRPKKYFLDFSWGGKRIKIYSDRHGMPLESYTMAQEIQARITAEIRDGVFDPSHYVRKFQSIFCTDSNLQMYLKEKEKEIAPSHVPTFRKHIKEAVDFFKKKDIREIRKLDLANFSKHLMEKNLSPKTVKNYLQTFHAFLGYMKKLELIEKVPDLPEIEITPYFPKWVDTDLQRKIFMTIPDSDKPIFAFLMLTGARPGEARALKVKDVDLKRGIMTIRATFSKNVYREKRKGKGAPPVVIPVHPELEPILEKAIEGKTRDAFVFTNPRTGKPYPENALRRLWYSVRDKLNLDKSLRLYDATRHSLASNLVMKNVEIYKVSRLLGHTNVSTTEKYAHLDVSRLRHDIAKVSVISFPGREEVETTEEKRESIADK